MRTLRSSSSTVMAAGASGDNVGTGGVGSVCSGVGVVITVSASRLAGCEWGGLAGCEGVRLGFLVRGSALVLAHAGCGRRAVGRVRLAVGLAALLLVGEELADQL